MNLLRYRHAALLAGCALTIPVWLAAFPSAPSPTEAILLKFLQFAVAGVAYLFVMRLQLRKLDVGWAIFTYALLLDFLDEFTREPEFLNLHLQVFMETIGLAVISWGLLGSYIRMRENLEQAQIARAALKESEEKYRLLFSKEMDSVILSDAETHRILDANESAVAAYGYSREELLQRTILDISAEPDKTQGTVRDVLARGSSRTPLRWHKKRDGTPFPVEIFSGAYDWRGRKVMCGIIRDITERRWAEEALRKSEQQFRGVWENSLDGMRVTDAEGRIVMVNDAFCRMSGLSRDELVGQLFTLIYTESSPASRLMKYKERFATRTIDSHYEREATIRHGEKVWFEVSNTFLEVQGEQPKLLSIFRDISERKLAEQERLNMERKLQETQKFETIGVLAGGVAHDFNNLLTGIVGHANLARMEAPAASVIHSHMERIERASMQAAGLCSQLLAYSGKGRIATQRLDLNAVIHDSLRLVDLSLPKLTSLKVELIPVPAITADPVQMRQVIMNLVINAGEAMGDVAGEITVTSRVVDADERFLARGFRPEGLELGRYVCLEVSDTGCGMNEETKERIFEPFYSTKFAGRGLGLAAVLGIVRGHKGGLAVRSSPGAGATFTILFPAVEGTAEPSTTPPNAAPIARGQGTVLIIDDDEDVRQVAAAIVKSAGYEVILAQSGDEGINRFIESTDEIRLVMLDLAMSSIDGEAIFNGIRRVRSDARILIFSGYAGEEVLKYFPKENLAGFLQKPFKADDLRARVRAALAV